MERSSSFLHPNSLQPRKKKPDRGVMLPVEPFDHRRGLNSLQVHITAFSKDGRLWAATPAGLACFDGVSVRLYGRRQGLINHGLRSLAIHPETGYLWIGTDTGIEVFDIHSGPPKPIWSNPIGTVNTICLQSGSPLIGTSSGLFFADDDNQLLPLPDLVDTKDTIVKILSDDTGHPWIIGAGSGLIKLTPAFKATEIDKAHQQIGSATTLANGPDGSLFVGGTKGICHINRDGRVVGFRPVSAPIDAMLWDNEKLWVSSDQSLISLSSDFTAAAVQKIHMKGVVIHHILKDRFENLWLSTSGQALLKISYFRTTLVEDFPTDAGQVLSIFSDKYGRLIGGSAGLVLPSGNVILKNMEIWDVLRDPYGKLWCATHKGLICTPNASVSFQYRHEDCRVIAAPCRALTIFKNDLYVASIRGLAKVESSGVIEILDADSESLGYVYSLHIGPEGRLWIATLGRGVFCYDGQSITSVEITDMAENANVYAFTHNRKGELYVAHDNKISRLNLDTTATTLYESKNSIAAWCLGWLPGNALATGSSTGLMILDDRSGNIRHRIFGTFENIPWEFTTSRSLIVSGASELYCGLGSGLRTVNPTDLMSSDETPVPRLAQIQCTDTDAVLRNGSIALSSGKWRLTLHIATEWMLDDSLMRYRLVGFDKDWSDYDRPSPIHYTSLPTGDYRLEVRLWSPLASHGPITKLVEIHVT